MLPLDAAQGNKTGLIDLSRNGGTGYEEHTRGEHREDVKKLNQHRDTIKRGKRVSTKARVQDISHTMKDISVNVSNDQLTLILLYIYLTSSIASQLCPSQRC
jgi:hypothetical protein